MPPIERPQSLSETVLSHLRQAIVQGDIELGQPLFERQLAVELGVSKTPVREALAELRREGLVRIVPQKGAFVFTLSAQEVSELCELRVTLESAALRLAMERNGSAFARDMDTVVRRMGAARAKGDERAYLKEDTVFHALFFDHCGNQYMRRAYDMVVGKIAALRTHLATKPLHTKKSFKEHQAMLSAVQHQDIERTLSILDVHIGRTRKTYATEIEDIAAADRAVRAVS